MQESLRDDEISRKKGVIVEVGLERRIEVCQVERGDRKNTAGAEGCAETGKSRGLVQVIRRQDPCHLPLTALTSLSSTSAEYL